MSRLAVLAAAMVAAPFVSGIGSIGGATSRGDRREVGTPRSGCRQAGCRTLKACLCSCRICKTSCGHRRTDVDATVSELRNVFAEDSDES